MTRHRPLVDNRSRVLRCLLVVFAFVLRAVALLTAVRQQLLPSHAAASASSSSVTPSTLYSLTVKSSGRVQQQQWHTAVSQRTLDARQSRGLP